MEAQNPKKKELSPWIAVPGTILVVLLLLPYIIVYILFYNLYSFFLHMAIWFYWLRRGRYILFVYSNSPIWHGYIEEQILPNIRRRAIILNWSERSKWHRSLAVLVFYHFGGSQEFNPLAIVFRTLRLHRSFQFYLPFRDYKHGKQDKVEKMKQELFALIVEIESMQAA